MTGLSHIHRFEAGADGAARPLLLLHGTGGDENDLLPLGRLLSPDAALLSPRGRVVENGMPRFFRRFAEGVFDEADLRLRTHELADFVGEARAVHGLAAPVAVGLSNGANVAAAMLLMRPEALAGAVLIRPMMPFREPPPVDLGALPVLILSGVMDPVAPEAQATRLAASLRERGAAVDHRVLPAGHGLTQADFRLAKEWLAGGNADARAA